MQRFAEALIVPAGPGDADALAKLHVETWRETYAGLLPAGYLGAMDVKRHAKRWRAQLAASVKPAPVLGRRTTGEVWSDTAPAGRRGMATPRSSPSTS